MCKTYLFFHFYFCPQFCDVPRVHRTRPRTVSEFGRHLKRARRHCLSFDDFFSAWNGMCFLVACIAGVFSEERENAVCLCSCHPHHWGRFLGVRTIWREQIGGEWWILTWSKTFVEGGPYVFSSNFSLYIHEIRLKKSMTPRKLKCKPVSIWRKGFFFFRTI